MRERAEPYWRDALEQLATRLGEPSIEAVLERTAEDVAKWTDQMQAEHPSGVEECKGLAEGLQTVQESGRPGLYKSNEPRGTSLNLAPQRYGRDHGTGSTGVMVPVYHQNYFLL